LGPPGLFLACFLDSSFLTLPEISDLLVVTSSAADPHSAWLPVLLATLGSVAGCSSLWYLARRGGEAYLGRRFSPAQLQRTRETFDRWGVLALAVPAMMPPPVPFKIFVLGAGVFGMRYRRFALTLTVSRGLRYVFWAVLGVAYGEQARLLLQAADAWFFLQRWRLLGLAAALTLVLATVYALRRRHRRAPEVS
jgi:membrane protein YqaA with SNARE-associated domain